VLLSKSAVVPLNVRVVPVRLNKLLVFANTELGTFSATDTDASDTFTYTLVNNSEAYFSINGNTLKLAKTVDYETTKNLSITVKVTDVKSEGFIKGMRIGISYSNRDIKVFGSFIIYSFSKF
jgi:hypothetical protein